MKCFVSTMDILNFKPIVPITEFNKEQAICELIKTRYPEAPIEGDLILKIKDGYKLEVVACPIEGGMYYVFERINK